jgi:hypothetical protein
MQILTPSGARYFCQGFSADASTTHCTVKDFIKRRPKSMRSVGEGAADFAALRDCLLREADRSLFLSNALYANVLQANRESTSWWSHVTLYYSAFFAAQGLLAMHGGWLIDRNSWIEVTNASPGAVELTINRTIHPQLAGTPPGSTHKSFWRVFYWAVRSLHTHAPTSLAFALSPIMSRDSWLIDSRNEYNYQSTKAFDSINEFINGYDPLNIPRSLPRHLQVIDNAASALLELGVKWRNSYNLAADVLANRQPTLQAALTSMVINGRDAALDAYAAARVQNLHV